MLGPQKLLPFPTKICFLGKKICGFFLERRERLKLVGIESVTVDCIIGYPLVMKWVGLVGLLVVENGVI